MDTPTLPPTTNDILELCPQFRILVVGKSGVGKSSLINRAFGVKLAKVSHAETGAGVCDITTQIYSPGNPRFVLHDSQGFEPGEIANFVKVKDFIQSHSKGVPLKDRVHVVWLCIEAPFAGGRAFETGDEEFIKFASNLKVPVIVVFTKFDKMISRMEEQLTDEELEENQDKIDSLCRERANTEFEKLCIGPLKKVDRDLPSTGTSETDRPSLVHLINLTQAWVESDVWIVSAMAQRASAQVKIDSSIRVGMTRYWEGLASSTSLVGATLEQCLATIHFDIISCWSFDDRNEILNGPGFQGKIKNLVELVIPDISKPNSWSDSLGDIQDAIGVATALVSGAGPAVAAIGLSTKFIKWAARVYHSTPEVLRCLMGYIVDLTLVMEQLFLVILSLKQPKTWTVTMEHVDTALEHYEAAVATEVHREIREYANNTTFGQICKSNKAQEKVIELIRRHRALYV